MFTALLLFPRPLMLREYVMSLNQYCPAVFRIQQRLLLTLSANHPKVVSGASGFRLFLSSHQYPTIRAVHLTQNRTRVFAIERYPLYDGRLSHLISEHATSLFCSVVVFFCSQTSLPSRDIPRQYRPQTDRSHNISPSDYEGSFCTTSHDLLIGLYSCHQYITVGEKTEAY